MRRNPLSTVKFQAANYILCNWRDNFLTSISDYFHIRSSSSMLHNRGADFDNLKAKSKIALNLYGKMTKAEFREGRL